MRVLVLAFLLFAGTTASATKEIFGEIYNACVNTSVDDDYIHREFLDDLTLHQFCACVETNALRAIEHENADASDFTVGYQMLAERSQEMGMPISEVRKMYLRDAFDRDDPFSGQLLQIELVEQTASIASAFSKANGAKPYKIDCRPLDLR